MQGKEVVSGEYVYLDQNIIIYARDEILKGSTYTPLFKAISNLKNQGVVFPYSDAHLLDFFSKSSKPKGQYASKNLSILSNISDNNMLVKTLVENKTLLRLEQCHPRKACSSAQPDKKLAFDIPSFERIDVDMSQVNAEHPFYEILTNNGEVLTSSIIEDFIHSLATDHKKFKHFNNVLRYKPEVLGNIPSKLCDFLELTTKEEDSIRNNYAEILKLHFELKGAQYDPSDASQLPDAYWVLNMCGGFRDKVSKNNTSKNLNTDGLHFFYAHKARYLISSDVKFLKKCNFLIRFFKLPVKTISKDDFLAM